MGLRLWVCHEASPWGDDPNDTSDPPQEHRNQPQPLPANSANKSSNNLYSDSKPPKPKPFQPNVWKPSQEDSDMSSEPPNAADEEDGECGRSCILRIWRPSLWRRLLLPTVCTLCPLYAPTFAEGFINFHSTIGIHPKLIHLNEQPSKRRNKHLEVASRHRTYKVNDATEGKRPPKMQGGAGGRYRYQLNARLSH